MSTAGFAPNADETYGSFPIFSEIAGRKMHPTKIGWGVYSNPHPWPGLEPPAHLITVLAPRLREAQVDLRRLPRDGSWQELFLFGEPVPIKIGWYKGGRHKGITRDEGGRLRKVRFRVPAGYYGMWT